MFQGKDFTDEQKEAGLPQITGNAVIEFDTTHIDNGGHAMFFAEGHRNKGDKRQVQDFRRGIAQVALGVQDPENLLMVQLGIAYKHYPRFPAIPRGPVITVAEPFVPVGMTAEEILDLAQTNTQEAMDHSFGIAAKKL